MLAGRLIALAAAALALAGAAPDAAPRVVSLNPSLTRMLYEIGAGATLVGVDEYSARLDPRASELPQVGGLFNPSLEAIVALEPSFVALVPSAQQRALGERLAKLGIEVLTLPNIRFDELLASFERLGERVGFGEAARRRSAEIRAAWNAARAHKEALEGARVVWVITRDPLYIVGAGSFLDEMLEAAGAENLGRAFDEPYPRVSIEWLLEAAPDRILDAADPPEEAHAHWARWPSLPAVAKDRIRITEDGMTLPGPHLDRSLEQLRELLGDAR